MAFDPTINAALFGVHRVKKHGRIYKYYRNGAFRRALPACPEFSDEFIAAYDRAVRDSERFTPEKKSTMSLRKQQALFGRILTSAKERAARKGVEFSLSFEDLAWMYQAQNAKCALTGIPFEDVTSTRCVKRPFSPSLDRLVTSAGYTAKNVRLVCQIANNARHSYSDEEFYRMCLFAARSHRNPRQIRKRFCNPPVNQK
jgi:hypothetical protein